MASKYDQIKEWKVTKARGTHTCEKCGHSIRPGDRYLRETLGMVVKPPGVHLAVRCIECGPNASR